MDPITITAGSLTISKLAGSLIVTLPNVWRTYSTAQSQLDDIVSLLHSLKIATTALSETLPLELNSGAQADNGELRQADRDLKSAVWINLNGCATLLKELNGQIDLVMGLDNKLTKWRKAKYVWKKSELDQLEGRLDRRVNALNLILNILSNPSRRVEVFSSNNRDTRELKNAADEVSLYSKPDDLVVVTRILSRRPVPSPATGTRESPKPIPINGQISGVSPKSISRLSINPSAQGVPVRPSHESSTNTKLQSRNTTTGHAAGVCIAKDLRLDEPSTTNPEPNWWPDAKGTPSPLVTAIIRKDLRAMRKALQLGADLKETVSWPSFAKIGAYSPTGRKLGPVGLAVIHCHRDAPKTDPEIVCEMIDLLIEYGADDEYNDNISIDKMPRSPISTAIMFDFTGRVVHHLVQEATKSTELFGIAAQFVYACNNMNLCAVRILLEEVRNSGHQETHTSYSRLNDYYPLHFVASGKLPSQVGDAEADLRQFNQIAELLISRGADLNTTGEYDATPLSRTIAYLFHHRCPTRVAWFLEQGASTKPDAKGNTLFHILGSTLSTKTNAKQRELAKEVYNLLLDAGIKPSQRNNDGELPNVAELM